MADDQVIDALYIPIIQPALAPAWIDYILRYHNVPTPRCDGGTGFRYIDLGCGYGMTLLYLAAAYPKAQFVGVDANAEHINFANTIARQAKLENVEFIASTFGTLDFTKIHQADYVIADGVFTWVPPEVRLELIEAFNKLLVPGGAALVSANLTPGWLQLMSVQRILADLNEDTSIINPDTFAETSNEFIKKAVTLSRSDVVRAGADIFSDIVDRTPSGYVVHEYLPTGWQPVWTADLAQSFSAIGVQYIADTAFNRLRNEYAFTKAQHQMLEDAQSDDLTLTLKDTFNPRFFARSLFHRSDNKMDGRSADSRLEGWIALACDPGEIEYSCYTPNGKLTFDSPTAHRLVDCLSGGVSKISDLMAKVEPPSQEIFLKVVDSLLASEAVLPVDPAECPKSVERLNRLIKNEKINTKYRATPHGTPMKI